MVTVACIAWYSGAAQVDTASQPATAVPACSEELWVKGRGSLFEMCTLRVEKIVHEVEGTEHLLHTDEAVQLQELRVLSEASSGVRMIPLLRQERGLSLEMSS